MSSSGNKQQMVYMPVFRALNQRGEVVKFIVRDDTYVSLCKTKAALLGRACPLHKLFTGDVMSAPYINGVVNFPHLIGEYCGRKIAIIESPELDRKMKEFLGGNVN